VVTEAGALVDLVRGLPGEIHLTIEEGTQSIWLHDLLSPFVARLVVCDPRKVKATQGGDKNDRLDARVLSELLRIGGLQQVYKGGSSMRDLKELVLCHTNVVKDVVRTKNRIKALFRARGLPTNGSALYGVEKRTERLDMISSAGPRFRAEVLFEEHDSLATLMARAEAAMLAEARKFKAWRLLQTVPGIGPVRSAEIMAWMVSPHRFRTRRQLWRYSGLAVVHRTSNDYVVKGGEIVKRKQRSPRGLNIDHNPHLKHVFKSAAVDAMTRGTLGRVAEQYAARQLDDALIRVTIARRIASICLSIWKTGEHYDELKAFPTLLPATD
jgi:transposase